MSEMGFQMLIKASTLPAKEDFSPQLSILADSCHRNHISHCAALLGWGWAKGSNVFTVSFTILLIFYNLELCADI